MQEKRKHRRVNLINRPEIYDARSNKFVGIMVDISTDGFRMITNNQIKQGKEYMLNIVLPGNGGEMEKVIVKAGVCWCCENIQDKMFAAGCRLVQIKARDRLNLAVLMLKGGNPREDAIAEAPSGLQVPSVQV